MEKQPKIKSSHSSATAPLRFYFFSLRYHMSYLHYRSENPPQIWPRAKSQNSPCTPQLQPPQPVTKSSPYHSANSICHLKPLYRRIRFFSPGKIVQKHKNSLVLTIPPKCPPYISFLLLKAHGLYPSPKLCRLKAFIVAFDFFHLVKKFRNSNFSKCSIPQRGLFFPNAPPIFLLG